METPTPPLLAGIPILVVEDDLAGARLLTVLLANAGGDVRVATSAEEALAMLRAFAPRVVVLDLVLPRMNGLLFARQLKSDPATRDIVIIAVSVINGPRTERLALESGCAAYVYKPIDIETFAQTILTHLEKKA